MRQVTNSTQNNDLLALYERLKGAPERERRAIERAIDGVLGTATPSTDALERHTTSVDLVKGRDLSRGRKALQQGYAAAPQVVPRGGRDEVMEARIAQHDPTCSGDDFVGGWGRRGLRRIAKESGYSLERVMNEKIRVNSANFIHAVERGRFTMPNSVTCVNSAFWATCPLSGENWGNNMRLETRTNRQGMVPGWSAGAIWHISGPALPDALPHRPDPTRSDSS